jgi:hypothetical protein
MEGNNIQKREELLEACHDLRLPVAGNENLETLEVYIQAAYDDFEDKGNHKDHQTNSVIEEEFDYGSIGDKSWRLKYFINKILFFL